MGVVLFTGFPGFLGSALLPRALRRSPDAHAVALVPERWLDTARRELARLEDEHPETAGRTRLVTGDITVAGLGLDAAERADLLAEPLEIFHRAAVYDLSVRPGRPGRSTSTGHATSSRWPAPPPTVPG